MINTIKKFILTKLPEFIIFFALILLFRLIFALGSLELSFYKIGFEIAVFGFVIYLIIAFFSYKEELSIKAENERLLEENKRLHMSIISGRRELKDYFSLWVHQVKTPITAAKLILDNNVDDRETKVKAQIMYIEQYCDMAINYLKLMNTETDMDIAELNLDEIIKSILKKYSTIFILNRITLNYEPILETVVSDAMWLSIMIEQFVSNALKYTKKGSVTISYDKENSVLYIRDTGMGIRSEDIPKIFDRGYSGLNGRMNEKSSGLGLFLAKEIGKRLSVEITVNSEVGKGSEFGLHFNLSKL
ncbi:ATPase/histidine kinase/DNA gyrase B/HSP90 domain protein [Catonella morbi ATCC 51271]|uniref:histidine kinase n=1 Tax=Catonella morbi ATCC 51271 TaxID=592026 RepID=V2Y6B2_9FIRM|nr:sensor histidine kinase [Catonella morbi]ESL04493.1 ATPase/histidine kinase/DNA gyrase B/HSP90 domain protein [Catonella morbi ATCC 51271]